MRSCWIPSRCPTRRNRSMWKNRVVWLVSLLAAGGLYFFDNGPETGAILLGVLLIPPLLAAAALLPAGRREIELEVLEDWERGTASRCVLRMRGLPSLAECRGDFVCRNQLTGEEVRTPFRLEGRRELGLSVTLSHCGKAEFSVERAALYDPFRLFCRRVAWGEMETRQVPPRPFLMEVQLREESSPLWDSDRYSASHPGSDPSETFQIREYIPGDPVRQIHWKLSEKAGRTMVREFGLPVSGQVLLLLETTLLPGCTVDGDEADAVMDVLCALSRTLTASGFVHNIGWQDGGQYREMEIRDSADFDALLDELLSCRFEPGERTVIERRAEQPGRAFAHLAVIAPYLPPDLALLRGSGEVTALVLDEAAPLWSDGAAVIPFSAVGFRQELGQLTL